MSIKNTTGAAHKGGTITVMSNTNYPVQYTIPVQDLDMDWFREQD